MARPPPSAIRVAISRLRVADRAITRPAMFTQPMSNTARTAAQVISSSLRMPRVSPGDSGPPAGQDHVVRSAALPGARGPQGSPYIGVRVRAEFLRHNADDG